MKTTDFKAFAGLTSTNDWLETEIKYSQRLRGWSLKKVQTLGVYIIKLDYITNNYESSCLLPLSLPLPEIKFIPPKEQPKKSWVPGLTKILQHPLIVAIPIIAIVFNFGAMAFGVYSAPIVSIGLVGLGLSACGIAATVLAYIGTPILRQRLSNKLDLIEEAIKEPIVPEYYDLDIVVMKDPDYSILKKISLLYRIFVNFFPVNKDLKWRYYYLEAVSHDRCKDGFNPDENPFIRALELCETDDQKFLCLRGFINSTARWCSKRKFLISYDSAVEPFVAQISSESTLHQNLRKKIKSQLDDCTLDLVTRNSTTAYQKFNAIEFDAYSKKAYPDLGVIYHQLDAILSIVEKKKVNGMIRHKFDDSILCGLAFKKLKLINTNYIFSFYPEKTSLYSNFYLDLQRFLSDLPSSSKPYPGKPMLATKVTIRQLPDNEFDEPPNIKKSTHLKIS